MKFIFLRSNQQAVQILFTLSNPLDELKPILCKSSDGIYKIFILYFIFIINNFVAFYKKNFCKLSTTIHH